MDLVAYSQYYRTRSPERQLEIDECLRRNLNHPGISRMVLFCESDAPPLPEGTVPVEVVNSDERITYAEWFRWVKRQGSGIGLLLNADIYLDEGLEHLEASFNTPEAFLALTRYNPGHAGFHLNDYPHWTQDVWGVRADAELPESLLYASSFPLGFPGCDNRIAYVMWSHGFRVRNPCYHVRSVHLQASTARGYNKTSDRLYGGVSYVHPSLAPDEDAELEFTLWTRSEQRPAGVLINQQAIEQGVHQLRHGEAEVAQRFLDLQQFTGLSWVHEAVGSAHLKGDLHPFASEDTVFLPLPALLEQGVELQLPRPTRLEGLTLRLPRRAAAGYRLELEAHGEGEAQLLLQGEAGLALKAGGERRFWQPAELKGMPWQRLRVKLSGPAADPAWRGEEGAELVFFGEEGALNQAKSLNVIAEEKGETQPPRLLRTVRFAAPEEIDPKNLTVQEGAIEAADGSPGGDGLTGSSEVKAVKYAYNSYSTIETGAYTASLVLKAGTQSRVVLRLNDQSGMNDVRQAFDLERGCKEGEAVTGGSATQASSRIRALGGGWYRCSISGVFREPVTCLHAPAVWFEHYAPSSSTGTLYTGEAQVLQGVEAHAPAEPAEQPAFALSASPADLAANADAPYRWRRRRDCQAQLASAEELHSYGNRFRVLRSGEELLFEDRFWPSIGVSPIAALPCGLEDAQGLLLWGFGQPALELRPGFIANTKRFGDDVNFWQYPCRTEGDAFAVHQSLVGPQLKDGVLQLYLGLPWATWIDRKAWPTSTLSSCKKRLEDLRKELSRFTLSLTVHTVCQHIFWRDYTHMLKAAGINELWLSHKPPQEEAYEGLTLHPWHLYAVNAREADRREGLCIKPPKEKSILASFIGAHMKHYMSEVRLRLKALEERDGFHIKIQDEWHFNPIVYGLQVGDPGVIARKGLDVVRADAVQYNQILSDSVFSLCPAGAGPNSLRLWEAMSAGSIPVILSDHLELPVIDSSDQAWVGGQWEDIVLIHPEAEIESLEDRLRSISQEEIEIRSQLCVQVMALVNLKTCIGMTTSRQVNHLPRSSTSISKAHPSPEEYAWRNSSLTEEVLQFFKPQQVQLSTSTRAEFTGISDPTEITLTPSSCNEFTVVHFDQCQLIKALEIASSKMQEACSLTVDFYSKYNTFSNLLPSTQIDQSSAEKWKRIDIESPTWAMGLRLLTTWAENKLSNVANKQSTLKLRIVAESEAYSRIAAELNKSGLLKNASDNNPARQDELFMTANVDNAQTLLKLRNLEQRLEANDRMTLFPKQEETKANLIGEEVADGSTMYVHLMNRNENVQRNLQNWLDQDFDELILLDWSSTQEVIKLPRVLDDPKVRVVRVEGQPKFIRTIAQNLASRMARNRHIFKCDSDVEIKGDFLGAHPLTKGQFWVGDWHQARDNNERHLHGEIFYHIDDFNQVAGYDERIKNYGQDDTNLKDRLILSGATKKIIDYNFLHHQEHPQETRAQGSHGVHPMVATYANRLMTAYRRLWSPHENMSSFRLLSIDNAGRYIRLALEWEPMNETNEKMLSEALDLVSSWYAPANKHAMMTAKEKESLVWASQTE